MEKEFKVALDVDGVICHWYKGICDKYNKPVKQLNDWNDPWIDKIYHEIANDKEFWLNLPVLNNIVPFDYDCYITSIPEPMKCIREQWIKNNNFKDVPVYTAEDKLPLAKKLNIDVLVDDKPSTIENFNKNSDIIGLLYMPYYYNDYCASNPYLPQFRDLNEIGTVINTFKNIQKLNLIK